MDGWMDVPGLHVRLAVLLGLRVVELECADSGARHEQEGDVLYVLDRLLVGVLFGSSRISSLCATKGRCTYIENLQDVQVADDYGASVSVWSQCLMMQTYGTGQLSQHGTLPSKMRPRQGQSPESVPACTTTCYERCERAFFRQIDSTYIGFPVRGLVICHRRAMYQYCGGDETIKKDRYLLRVEVLRAIGVLLEELAAAVTEELVVGDLYFECAGVPLVVELDVIRVDEGQLLICGA